MFLPLHDTNPIRHIRRPYVTYAMIALNLLVFLVQLSVPGHAFNTFATQFGMVPIVVRGVVPQLLPWLPDWANLVTYAFLHVSWLHMLTNMLFLWIFGDNVEDALGHFRFFIFYLLCGVLAALVHLAFDFDGNSALVGASGAVSGVMGAYILLYPHARVIVLFRIIIPIPLPIPALWMLGVWIAVQLFNVVVGSQEPVSWWAHLGGVTAGALLVIPLRRREVPLFGGR